MIIAVIPARGGSKRIPRKNIKDFCGKPIIAWSIETASESNCFDRIIVSTDDAEVAEVARRYGAEAPFVRPPELSDDHTGTAEVVAHAIRWCAADGPAPSITCCLYATAPFVRVQDLQQGRQALEETGSDYVFTVTTYPFPIQRALRLARQGGVEMFQPQHASTRSQDLEVAYHDAGLFYWGRSSAWLAMKAIYGSGATAVVLPRHRVQDIDTPEDWERAERMFRADTEQ